MNKRIGLLAAGGLAVAVVMGGGVALATTTGPVTGGVITGCYTTAEVNGSHALVLQDAGTTCPKGTSAVSWGEQGPAGPAGATGPAGPAGPTGAIGPTGPAGPEGATGPAGAAGAEGATGPAGAQGPQGQAGTNGNTILNGTGAPTDTLGNNGDFYIDTQADVLYGPKAAGTWPTLGTSLVGPQGPAGATGSQGPTGPQGSPGTSGLACTTDGGAPGAVVTSTASNNSVSLTCVALTTDANCTHSNGVGETYTDCNDMLGTYNETTAENALAAYTLAAFGFSANGGQAENLCGSGYAQYIETSEAPNPVTGFIEWFYAPSPQGGQPDGTVWTVSGNPADEGESGCDITSTGMWN